MRQSVNVGKISMNYDILKIKKVHQKNESQNILVSSVEKSKSNSIAKQLKDPNFKFASLNVTLTDNFAKSSSRSKISSQNKSLANIPKLSKLEFSGNTTRLKKAYESPVTIHTRENSMKNIDLAIKNYKQ